MPSKDGWILNGEHDKVTLGRKQYRNMEEWTRPCGVCGEPFNIFVRANAGSINASFGLRTCKEHRGQKIGGGVLDPGELEQLRSVNGIMKEELTATYARNKELSAELQAIKARLAQYELPAAMAAVNKMPWE